VKKDKEKTLVDQKTEAMLEEIRTKVFERYADMRGVETQESALQATLDALQDITGVPKTEIDKIAAEVQQKHYGNEIAQTDTFSMAVQPEMTELTFERLRKRAEDGRRGFIYQLIPYVAVNTILIYLNVISTSFPWAIFPLFGWGIGLAAHFMSGVVYPLRDLKTKTDAVRTQVHRILSENWPGFISDNSGRLFNNVYRLIVTECSKELLEEYLRNADSALTDERVKQISTQLISLQNQFVTGKRKKKR